MEINIVKKDWDSDFFGFPISEIRSESISKSDIISIVEGAKEKFDLIYLITSLESSAIESENCFLADAKVTYRKNVLDQSYYDEKITLFSKDEDYNKLIKLAFDSGVYSRFKTDPNFNNKEFEKLYTEWIKKSVDGRLADAVLVYKSGENIEGMVTVKLDNLKGNIGLIAVNEESRGNKIGKKLIDAVNNYALKAGCTIIEVPTQMKNVSACNFYEKNGFTISSIEYIYHLWLKKSNENSI